MKRTLTILTLALAALAASAERFAPATGSLIRVEGTSTLHEWTMEGADIKGQIDSTAPNATVTIPVASIRSSHAKMDKLMSEALKAKQFPEIRYELIEATQIPDGAASFTTKTKGRLTIAGVTREIAIDVQGSRGSDGRYVLTGTAPVKMTSFGIKPPVAMMGTIKTGDDVKVTFRWIVVKAN
ncbi:MAG TPA: YceI family protein [Thermoanaerobaculia bacterium]|nr:YceI family protein [Thermoanaerobaculia bacterium]